MTIEVTFPDGRKKSFRKGISGAELAKEIGFRRALAVKVNDGLKDLSTGIDTDCSVKFLRYEEQEGREVFWHTSDHILAQAISRLYPAAKLTIGPNWENGFFYDIDMPPLKEDDLEKIEQEMGKIVSANLKVERVVMDHNKALELFRDNPYKVEVIKESTDKEVSAYKQGEFIDLCRGPHLPETGLVKAFKLTKLSGAYWKGDQSRQQLQRIYGVSFPEKSMLENYLHIQAEAEKRDHRVLGKKLELFMFHEWSPGSPIILPKGTIIYNELMAFLRQEYARRGYNEVITPQLFNKALWELSGHWQHYRENMFLLHVDNEDFSLKPMNCPSHILIFKSRTRSYRELPLRIADFCYLHRNELKGVLGGMTRVRKFSQDDAHIFLADSQVQDEISRLLDFFRHIYVEIFRLDFKVKLSTKPDKAMGAAERWQEAEAALADALRKNGLEFELKPGEGAFYGPKIDIDLRDSLGRDWQLCTIQLDFQMPERMGAEYEGADGKKHAPVMIHRALIGTFERFLGVLTEHFAGKFPLWLSPEQVRILTVADRFNDYAEKVCKEYAARGIRASVDTRAESINYKVREAQMDYVNYILVVGEREVKDNTVTVRTRDNKVIGAVGGDEFAARLAEEISSRRIV
ncbi:threonine--tRNA ligase [Candidatus Woesearchaeota archaeon]|nr:threonine--tRNA ligase [Candidatus Woesearchaeota archaeon]